LNFNNLVTQTYNKSAKIIRDFFHPGTDGDHFLEGRGFFSRGWSKLVRPFKGHESIVRYSFDKGNDIRADISNKYSFTGDLLDIYANHKDSIIHKWHHYLPIYDRYFSKYRGTQVRFLEIGVSKGGSLAMWRKYLGPDAIIYGIDVDESCRVYDGVHGNVRIGSQDDPDFLASVISEMGGVDLILDDGSHRMWHVKKSLEILFPMLSMGGAYMIEDLHTAYWVTHGGGLRSRNNFYIYLRELIDDLHRWYHPGPVNHKVTAESLTSLHVYDSIVVLEKNVCHAPVHSMVP